MSVNLTKQKLEEMVKKQLDIFLQEQKHIINELPIPGRNRKKKTEPKRSREELKKRRTSIGKRQIEEIIKNLKSNQVSNFGKLLSDVNQAATRSLEYSDGLYDVFSLPGYWKDTTKLYRQLYSELQNYVRTSDLRNFNKNKKALEKQLEKIEKILTYSIGLMDRTMLPTPFTPGPQKALKNAQLLKAETKAIKSSVKLMGRSAEEYDEDTLKKKAFRQEKLGKKLLAQEKVRVDSYNAMKAIDAIILKNARTMIDRSLFDHVLSTDGEARNEQNRARFNAVKQAIQGKRIKKLKGARAIIDLAEQNDLQDFIYRRLRQYGLRRVSLDEGQIVIKEQNAFADAIRDAQGAADDAGDTPRKNRTRGKGRSSRKGRFMKGQESFRAEFEARFGTGREGFEEFYDNLALHGIKIKEDGIFGKNHERAFKKYLVMQSKNPKITKGSETKKPEEVKAERPKYYAEKEAAEKKDKAEKEKKKKLLPPDVAKRRLRSSYTQKLQDIFKKAGTPAVWQDMYDKLKRRMVSAYTNMTGEKLDTIEERDADELMINVLPSLGRELDLNLMAVGREPIFINATGTFSRGMFIPDNPNIQKQVEQWKASFKA